MYFLCCNLTVHGLDRDSHLKFCGQIHAKPALGRRCNENQSFGQGTRIKVTLLLRTPVLRQLYPTCRLQLIHLGEVFHDTHIFDHLSQHWTVVHKVPD